jgi:hypothetical protein
MSYVLLKLDFQLIVVIQLFHWWKGGGSIEVDVNLTMQQLRQVRKLYRKFLKMNF